MKGKTIAELDKNNEIPAGDNLQVPYKTKHVWHTLDYLRIAVADEIKLSPDLIGPNRRNNDFYDRTIEVIEKLRKDGLVSVWNKSKYKWRLALRLTSPQTQVPIDTQTWIIDPPPYEEKATIKFGEENDMRRVFTSIITPRGEKDNTYKFTLAKILLDYSLNNRTYNIPYSYLAEKFLEHYWYQEYVYKIKQDFKKKKQPEVIKALHRVFGDDPPADFEHIDKKHIVTAKSEILKNVFGHDRKRKSMVVPRFQNIPGNDGEMVEYSIFYDYNDDKQMIYMRPEAVDFFRRNHAILFKAVIAEWAKFLERANGSLPDLVSKIEIPNKERGVLKKYQNMYGKYDCCCFYCRTRLEKNYTEVDHFIPWSYIFRDEAWNLVLACQSCNRKKNNYLPYEEFKDILIKRNKKHYNDIYDLKKSLDKLNVGRGWATEINTHYETCLSCGFGTKRLP